jgi:hypothetical protein
MTKKRLRCAYCKKPFKPPERGRPPRYCCPSHRQMGYAKRRAYKLVNVPSLVLGQDIDDMRTKAGVERAVIDVLRRLGMLPPDPPKPPPLHLVR